MTGSTDAVRVTHGRLIPLIIACALFMESLDSTAIATALPAIAASLGADPLHLSLAITSYLFSLAVFIPISGWLTDRFGTRTMLLCGIALFVLGSLGCAQSRSLLDLVAARTMQGIGGSLMMPVGRLVLLRSIPKHDLVRAMAWVTLPALLGPVLGPPVGGLITTYASWRWIFWINIPIGLAFFLLVARFIPQLRLEPGPFDGTGFLLCAGGLLALVAGLETGGRGLAGWPTVLLALAGGTGLLAAYVRHSRGVARPVIDLTLLRIPSFRATILGGSLYRIGIGAIPVLLPMLLQLGFGLSAFRSGLLTFASAAGAMAMKATAAPILRRFGFRRVLLVNSLLGSVSIAAMALFGPATPAAVIVAILLAGGFSRSLQFTSLNTLAYADVEPAGMSRATSFSSTAQQLALSLGAAVGALLLHAAAMAQGLPPTAPAAFPAAFLGTALIALLSAGCFLSLSADAGAEVSGHAR